MKTKKIAILRTDRSSVDLSNLDDEKNFTIDLIQSLTENGSPLVLSNFKREISVNILEMPMLSKRQSLRLLKKVRSNHKRIKKKIILEEKLKRERNVVQTIEDSLAVASPYRPDRVENYLIPPQTTLNERIISPERLPHMRVITR